MDGINVRQAISNELKVAADYFNAMVIEAFDQNWDELYPNWRELFISSSQKRIAGGLQRYYVGEAAGKIVAVAGAQVGEAFIGAARGYVEGVYVLPAFRRRGLGAYLMRECIDWLKCMACDVVRLQATISGRPLYESLGFTDR